VSDIKCHTCGETRDDCKVAQTCIIGKASTDYVDGEGALWTWLPQVGGYTAPCRVWTAVPGDLDSCFEVSVYHDGEFPSGEVEATLHFCSVEQLERFAKTVRGYLGEEGP